MSRFPVPNKTVDECRKPDGTLDDGLVSQALNCEGVMSSSDDNLAVKAFTLEYLKQLEGAVRRMSENPVNGARTVDVRTEPETPEDRRTERNMAKGRHAYVRLDVTDCLDGAVCEGGERTGESPLKGSDVLRFALASGDKVIVRPSGTEPKIKIYLLTHGGDCAARLEKLAGWAKTLA